MGVFKKMGERSREPGARSRHHETRATILFKVDR